MSGSGAGSEEGRKSKMNFTLALIPAFSPEEKVKRSLRF